jgi:NitT/TauT family transport system ATP-binding protein
MERPDPLEMTAAGRAWAPAIEFEHVCLEYGGRPVLADLSLTVGAGEIVCIIGPSGCGKTTALRVAGGLARLKSGSVRIAGKPVTGPRRDVAIVFQDYGKALLPWRTAAGNVSLALEAAGIAARERRGRVGALLEKVGLQGHAEKYPTEMSGGMQQRLQIARCLAQEPSVLLMDEPFGALDAMTRQTLQDEMLSIVAETGATVFFVTHDLEEAIYLGDRVIGLLPNPGRVGTVRDVGLPRPRSQLETREMPEFLRLRRVLFDFIEKAEG